MCPVALPFFNVSQIARGVVVSNVLWMNVLGVVVGTPPPNRMSKIFYVFKFISES